MGGWFLNGENNYFIEDGKVYTSESMKELVSGDADAFINKLYGVTEEPEVEAIEEPEVEVIEEEEPMYYHVCHQCSRKFDTPQGLQSHIRSHRKKRKKR